jgi:prepilin-type N-terminal cleavage/methylation domain-containing protein
VVAVLVLAAMRSACRTRPPSRSTNVSTFRQRCWQYLPPSVTATSSESTLQGKEVTTMKKMTRVYHSFGASDGFTLIELIAVLGAVGAIALVLGLL